MMPGETHPAAPGPADLARCQGCASLQQNLNEYVEALIALKQKIINTDNLLTEYQKKCDELQFARRENSTLHHQVEQMLQKISPLQKCQEELGSLKAELEEKKVSVRASFLCGDCSLSGLAVSCAHTYGFGSISMLAEDVRASGKPSGSPL